jgi:hypothetical protein
MVPDGLEREPGRVRLKRPIRESGNETIPFAVDEDG